MIYIYDIYNVDSPNGSKWWITETHRERTPRRFFTMARQAGPISGIQTIQHHHNVFGLGNAEWSHTVNMGHGAQRAPKAGKNHGGIQIQHFRSKKTCPNDLLQQLESVQEVVAPRKSMSHPLLVPPNCRVVQKTVRRKGTSSKQEPIWNGTHHLSDWFSINPFPLLLTPPPLIL